MKVIYETTSVYTIQHLINDIAARLGSKNKIEEVEVIPTDGHSLAPGYIVTITYLQPKKKGTDIPRSKS